MDAGFTELQLATLVDAAPAGGGWLHEQKFDGYRILAVREARHTALYTRRGKDWTASFPTIAEAVDALPGGRLILDGEVAVVDDRGLTSFQALQQAIGTRSPRLVYFVFDLLGYGRGDLRERPLRERKQRLAELLAGAETGGIVRYSDHVEGGGAAVFAAACERGLEGIVSKRADAPYAPGRGTTWVKTKCRRRQELVVGGYTDPTGRRTGVGALLVGTYDGARLVYGGKVGAGFTHRDLNELAAALAPLVRPTSPFEPVPTRSEIGSTPHWVEPRIVVEAAFVEWTEGGRLRHPSFQGIRRDKPPAEVVRE